MSPIELNPTAQPASANPPAAEPEHTPATKEMSLAQIAAECQTTLPLSVQSVYAGMQLEQAKLCKDAAQKKAKDMQEIQEKQGQIAQLIMQARSSQAVNKEEMPSSVVKAMKDLGLSVETKGSSEKRQFDLSDRQKAEQFVGDLENILHRYSHCCKESLEFWITEIKKGIESGADHIYLSDGGFDYIRALLAEVEKGPDSRDTSDSAAPLYKRALEVGMSLSSGKGEWHSVDKDQWEFNIKSLTNYQEQVGSKTQSIMVSLQDFLGQFNSYLQGANAAITEAIRLQSKLNSGEQ